MVSKNKKVQFTRLDHATVEDFKLIMPGMRKLLSDLPNNILDLLDQQKGAIDNFPVNRCEHCLQTATRVYVVVRLPSMKLKKQIIIRT